MGSTRAPTPAHFEALSDATIATLASPAALQTLLALDADARTVDEIARDTGATSDEARARLTQLMLAGVAELVDHDEPIRFRARHTNILDEHAAPANRVQFRTAMLGALTDLIRAGRKALLARPEANVGIAFVTLPESKETFAEVVRIMAETEAKLKELQRATPPGDGSKMRVAVVVASQ